ncbi:MAG: DUF1801 domain-containing protein [Erysipelothrix sp.]|nr:DUF1801 domain-containing protein [Erysipelothrix sp.]
MDPIQTYIEEIDEKRRPAYEKLLDILKTNLPKDFELKMQYGMPSFVVPRSLYPEGYHTDPKMDLPFLSLGIQKGHIGIYHLGIYANEKLLSWFQEEYSKQVPTKLNMGKSCIRLTNVDNIPYDLFAKLASQMSAQEWISIYDNNINKSK